MIKRITSLALAAALACMAALPAAAQADEWATPETASLYGQATPEAAEPDTAQETAQSYGAEAGELTVTSAGCTAQYIDGAYRLFLPVNADLTALTIDMGALLTGTDSEALEVDGTAVTGDFSGIETVNVLLSDGTAARVEIYQSQLPCVSISLNGVTLDEIHAGSKDIKYKGNTLTISQSGEEDFTDTDVELKGRGNTTWNQDKRPYQFKLSSKAKVLGMDKAKTWLLIANRMDKSMMRNKAVYDVANAMGDWAPDGRWVDLWVDGAYQGCYLLCEKVQAGTNRVELNAEDGILAEADNIYYNGEEFWFVGERSETHFTLKDSAADDTDEENSKALQAWDEFEDAINVFENALYASEKDWDTISSLIDVQSFADYYLISEWVENWDTFRSSTFCYRDGAGDVLHMGPVWDYDLALNNVGTDHGVDDPRADYAMNIQDYEYRDETPLTWFTELMKCAEFRQVVCERYQSVMRPLLEDWDDTCAEYSAVLENSAKMEYVRWDLADGDGTARSEENAAWQQNTDALKNWVAQRTAYMTERLNSDFAQNGNRAESITVGEDAWMVGQGASKTVSFRVKPASACDPVQVSVEDTEIAEAAVGLYAGTVTLKGKTPGTTTVTVQAGSVSVQVDLTVTAETANGWYEENGKYYWYVNGERQGTTESMEITDPATGYRYWLDSSDGGARAENRRVQLEPDRLCYFDEEGRMVLGESYDHGGWNYYDPETGAQCRGPVVLPDGRKVFYDLTKGTMLHGEAEINGAEYVFDKSDGHLVSGPDSLFWIELDGKSYWYENWVRQGYDPADPSYRGKEIYDPASDAWYWLDNGNKGAMAVSKDVYQESDGGKWVRYDADGHMVKGWDTNANGTYYFDPLTGAMVKGEVEIDGVTCTFDEATGIGVDLPDLVWVTIDGRDYWYENGQRQGREGRGKEIYDPASDAWYWLDAVQDGAKAVSKDVYQESDGGKWVRYDADGRMVKGWDTNENGTYYFDPITGAMAKGKVEIDGVVCVFDEATGVAAELPNLVWVTIGGKDYWYENGRRQGLEGRGKEIYDPASDAWYWLDAVQDGAKAVSKDVYQESDGGKWVRYDADGHMVKGWDTNENGTYYFDPITGAMTHGSSVIDGETYLFDDVTGTLITEQTE